MEFMIVCAIAAICCEKKEIKMDDVRRGEIAFLCFKDLVRQQGFCMDSMFRAHVEQTAKQIGVPFEEGMEFARMIVRDLSEEWMTSTDESEPIAHRLMPFPSFAELEAEFGKGNVAEIFDGRPFVNIPECAHVNAVNGSVDFLVAGMPAGPLMSRNWPENCRPATHFDLYAYKKSGAADKGTTPIAAIGSQAMHELEPHYPLLLCHSGLYGLGHSSHAREPGMHYLFVRA